MKGPTAKSILLSVAITLQKSLLAPWFELGASFFIYCPVPCPLAGQVSVIRFIDPQKTKLGAYRTTLSHQMWVKCCILIGSCSPNLPLAFDRVSIVLTSTLMQPRLCFGRCDARSTIHEVHIFSRALANGILAFVRLCDRMSGLPSWLFVHDLPTREVSTSLTYSQCFL